MNYDSTLKSHVEKFDLKPRSWPDRSCCISVDPYRRPEHSYCVLIALTCFFQKLLPKNLLGTFYDLKWPRRHEEGSLVAIFRFRVSSVPVTAPLGVFRMVFVLKRRLSIFSHWPMERSQNWPDLGSPISKSWDTHFVDIITDIDRWKFQGDRSVGVAMTSIQTFSEIWSLDVTWWPDLEWSGSFVRICEKPDGVSKSLPLVRRGLSWHWMTYTIDNSRTV